MQSIHIHFILENKQTYLSKYGNEADAKSIVNKFWEIRSKLKAPENDIDWWIKKPFSELKDFVLNYKQSNKRDRRNFALNQELADAGAQMLDIIDGYEVWYIPNYETACIIGRNYKNRPTHWCISSDDPEYWFENHSESEFIFLVREDLQHDEYDKVAIEFLDGGRYFDLNNIELWNLDDYSFSPNAVITE